MIRTEVINKFIEVRGYKSYLEIGVFSGENYHNVNCEFKVGVDPVRRTIPREPHLLFILTSDEYFEELIEGTPTKDIIFIDGLHKSEQVARDIENSLKILSPGGVLLLHDCNPPTKLHARLEYTNEIPEWNGDVYKAFIDYKRRHTGYDIYTIDTDWGIGVIDDSKQGTGAIRGTIDSDFPEITWEYFDENREQLLNLITPEQFLHKLYESRSIYNGV